MGCWSPLFGVVDVKYAATIFPNNNAWDYAFCVVSDTGAHTSGFLTGFCDALDRAAGSMGLSFSEPAHDMNDSSDFTSPLLLQRRPELHVLRRGHDEPLTGRVCGFAPRRVDLTRGNGRHRG